MSSDSNSNPDQSNTSSQGKLGIMVFAVGMCLLLYIVIGWLLSNMYEISFPYALVTAGGIIAGPVGLLIMYEYRNRLFGIPLGLLGIGVFFVAGTFFPLPGERIAVVYPPIPFEGCSVTVYKDKARDVPKDWKTHTYTLINESRYRTDMENFLKRNNLTICEINDLR